MRSGGESGTIAFPVGFLLACSASEKVLELSNYLIVMKLQVTALIQGRERLMIHDVGR